MLAPRVPGLLLPAVPVAGYERVAGRVTLLVPDSPGPASLLASLHEGETARLEGPLGRGFQIDARSRFLLVVAEVEGLARVRAVVDEAISSGRQVTVLLGAHSVAEVFPSTLLPEEAEYVIATADGSLGHEGRVTDLVGHYEAWADQCFAAGSRELLASLTRLASGRDARMGVARLGRRRARRGTPDLNELRRRAWLQVALQHDVGCALGICLGCATDSAEGTQRVCREGPTFAAAELAQRTAS